MDRGRQIDNIQNTNAVFIDNFGQHGKTSVKTSNPPGGKSNFSLGWCDQQDQPKPTQGKKRFAQQNSDNMNSIMGGGKPVHTSVEVTKNPGGQSNSVFGADDSNYENYRRDM